MKFRYLVLLLATLASSPPGHSGEVLQTTARILGTIPDGTPPPPEPPKPEFVVPSEDILRTTFHHQGGRTITLRRIKPIDLPPPPEPTAFETDPAFAESVAEYHKTHPGSKLLFMGATVYRSETSPPRTLVRYWPQNGRESVTYWSSADFALIAGGISSFVDTAGQSHSLMMAWGNVDIEQLSKLSAAAGKNYVAPEIPALPAGQATFEIIGTPPAAEDLVHIQSLHDLYNRNLNELRTAFEGREQARLAREAELKANPPQPKDITLNFWRTEKPAPAKGAAK